MKIARMKLQSVSPYSSSRGYEREVEMLEKERKDDYEKRTWRNRLHVDELGYVRIPAMAFKNGLANTAKFLSIKIPGKRNATYTKHFLAGLLVLSDVVLSVKGKDVPGEWLFVPADGVVGSGKRVWKCFPRIEEWSGVLEVHILDGEITQEVFAEHMKEFGRLIGVGRFAPRRGGYFGRFKVVGEIEWIEDND